MSENGVTFEDAMRELEDILQTMADNQLSLDDNISYYAKAAQLMDKCAKDLAEAKVRVEKIDSSIAQTRSEHDL